MWPKARQLFYDLFDSDAILQALYRQELYLHAMNKMVTISNLIS